MIGKEMQSWYIKQDMTPNSSPIILITRKNSNLKRIITDFRFLNSILQRMNLIFPLIKDAFGIL